MKEYLLGFKWSFSLKEIPTHYPCVPSISLFKDLNIRYHTQYIPQNRKTPKGNNNNHKCYWFQETDLLQ